MPEFYTKDYGRLCPGCDARGHLDFVEIPASQLIYKRDHTEVTEHLAPSREYNCRNCDCTFLLTKWED